MESSDFLMYGLIIVAALFIWVAVKVIKKVMMALLVAAAILLAAAFVYFRFIQNGM